MRRSSILLATIANDAGLPVSKAEKIVAAIVNFMLANTKARMYADAAATDTLSGFVGGLVHALVLLGASADMVSNCADMLIEEKNTPAHD